MEKIDDGEKEEEKSRDWADGEEEKSGEESSVDCDVGSDVEEEEKFGDIEKEEEK